MCNKSIDLTIKIEKLWKWQKVVRCCQKSGMGGKWYFPPKSGNVDTYANEQVGVSIL